MQSSNFFAGGAGRRSQQSGAGVPAGSFFPAGSDVQQSGMMANFPQHQQQQYTGGHPPSIYLGAPGVAAPCMNPPNGFPGLSLGSPRTRGMNGHPPHGQGPPSGTPDPLMHLTEPYQGHVPMQPWLPNPQ